MGKKKFTIKKEIINGQEVEIKVYEFVEPKETQLIKPKPTREIKKKN